MKGEILFMKSKLYSFAIIDETELTNIIGGKNTWHYWGNGVYTKGNKVRTDWNQAWHAVGRISSNSWANGLAHIR